MNHDFSTKEGLANAVTWTQEMLNVLTNRGTWVIPRSGTVVQVDKAMKTAYITRTKLPEDELELVLEAMGWTVVYRQ